MFCHITKNWRGRPLINHEVIVNLIGNTTTDAGLRIQAELDKNTYPTRIAVSDQDLKAVNLIPAKFHGKDWNYRHGHYDPDIALLSLRAIECLGLSDVRITLAGTIRHQTSMAGVEKRPVIYLRILSVAYAIGRLKGKSVVRIHRDYIKEQGKC